MKKEVLPNQTAVTYLSYLSAKQQKQYVTNFIAQSKYEPASFLQLSFVSFTDFMYASFVWKNTPEGHKYWEKITNKF